MPIYQTKYQNIRVRTAEAFVGGLHTAAQRRDDPNVFFADGTTKILNFEPTRAPQALGVGIPAGDPIMTDTDNTSENSGIWTLIGQANPQNGFWLWRQRQMGSDQYQVYLDNSFSLPMTDALPSTPPPVQQSVASAAPSATPPPPPAPTQPPPSATPFSAQPQDDWGWFPVSPPNQPPPAGMDFGGFGDIPSQIQDGMQVQQGIPYPQPGSGMFAPGASDAPPLFGDAQYPQPSWPGTPGVQPAQPTSAPPSTLTTTTPVSLQAPPVDNRWMWVFLGGLALAAIVFLAWHFRK